MIVHDSTNVLSCHGVSVRRRLLDPTISLLSRWVPSNIAIITQQSNAHVDDPRFIPPQGGPQMTLWTLLISSASSCCSWDCKSSMDEPVPTMAMSAPSRCRCDLRASMADRALAMVTSTSSGCRCDCRSSMGEPVWMTAVSTPSRWSCRSSRDEPLLTIAGLAFSTPDISCSSMGVVPGLSRSSRLFDKNSSADMPRSLLVAHKISIMTCCMYSALGGVRSWNLL